MGTSHSEMLAEVRLEMACRLLAESSKRLSDIARFLGYSNPSSFSRTFVRLMRVRPVAYRRQQLARQHRQGRQRRKLNAIND
ncbi:AraC family transcriptional regulator [Bradyrhizobium sp. CB1650]|nr:AraC family transcriptional regulator [Bradyrhizobium sp. CB1650]WGD56714.1 AraC family transcriptional regulator [Bradyrhizobium sp. CB1650]